MTAILPRPQCVKAICNIKVPQTVPGLYYAELFHCMSARAFDKITFSWVRMFYFQLFANIIQFHQLQKQVFRECIRKYVPPLEIVRFKFILALETCFMHHTIRLDRQASWTRNLFYKRTHIQADYHVTFSECKFSVNRNHTPHMSIFISHPWW